MIICFSGTGNSLAIARALAAKTKDRLLFMTFEASADLRLKKDECLGFVFPVYGWGMPNVVQAYINRLHISAESQPYIYMVCSCGDDIGRTDRLLARSLRQKGYTLNAAWSVSMPNTYIVLPGFDTDSPRLQASKLARVPDRIAEIVALIASRTTGICDVNPGVWPTLKSYVIRPIFNALLVTDKRFYHTSACVGCRRCIASCPVGNIEADQAGRPVWKGRCTGCLACYHSCPHHSIAYGKFTGKKGQYHFPANIKLEGQ